METINIINPNGPDYDIIINTDYSKLSDCCANIGLDNIGSKKVCIVTDSNVGELYAQKVKKELLNLFSRVEIYTFPAGEENKNLDTVKGLYTFLINNHFDRKDILAALGGGVTGDLCGFASATYLRGIDFIQIPTSLLAQVDSSIGGKTGVDFDSFKNMVGAFHMPRLVYMNLSVLKTLDARQFSCGMAEIVKHGFIQSSDYLDWILDNREKIKSFEPDTLTKLVYDSCKIKGYVVENDPKENGIRAYLNFGHTLGHAIEKLMDFRLLHGECVALGCVAASLISLNRGLITAADHNKLVDSIGAFGLNTKLDFLFKDLYKNSPEVFIEEVITFTRSDKKAEHGRVKFVLLKSLGEAFTDRSVTEDEMKAALRAMV